MRGGASDQLSRSEWVAPCQLFRLVRQQAEEELRPFPFCGMIGEEGADPDLEKEYSKYLQMVQRLERCWKRFLRRLPEPLRAALQNSEESEQVKAAWQQILADEQTTAAWQRCCQAMEAVDDLYGVLFAAALLSGQGTALAI